MRSAGVAYFGVRHPPHVRRDLRALRRLGMDAILHTFSEEDYRWYGAGAGAGGGRGTMAAIVAASKTAGFRTYLDPWGVGGVFGGEALSELVARNPAWAQIDSAGDPTRAACINNADFRAWMTGWVAAAAATGADLLFWDEPHFATRKDHPDLWCCRCACCRDGFRRASGAALPAVLTPEVRRFRADSMLAFLREMTDAAAARGVRNAVCLVPLDHADSPIADGADWRRIAAMPAVAEIAATPYWREPVADREVHAAYRRTASELLAVAAEAGKSAHIWVKLFALPAGTESRVAAAIAGAAEAGIERIMAWSYLATAPMSAIACADPDRAWRLLLARLRAWRGDAQAASRR